MKLRHLLLAVLVACGGSKKSPTAPLESELPEEARAAIAFHQVVTPGIYHVVVHDAADCGKNATKIGPAFEPVAGVALTLTVEKGSPAELDEEVDYYTLDGADSIVGRTFVLHADKKGKPGKAVACGAIAATDDDRADEE